jgi:hypothetical protein
MIPYDLDPSLHTAEPESTMFDDGFSPPQPAHATTQDEAQPQGPNGACDPALAAKSPF